MFVFVAGMQRSGSTFAFNVARDVLRARGMVHQEAPGQGDVAGALVRSGPADHVLVKAHEADVATLDLVRRGGVSTICTVRRIEDAAASWLETFDNSEAETVTLLRGWLELYGNVRNVALIVPFAQVDRAPWLAAWRIARFLDPKARVTEVLGIARRYAKRRVKLFSDTLPRDAHGVHDAGFTYYDRATFFHRGHVSSLRSRPAEARLEPGQLERIRAALAPDMARARFPASKSFAALAQMVDMRVRRAPAPKWMVPSRTLSEAATWRARPLAATGSQVNDSANPMRQRL